MEQKSGGRSCSGPKRMDCIVVLLNFKRPNATTQFLLCYTHLSVPPVSLNACMCVYAYICVCCVCMNSHIWMHMCTHHCMPANAYVNLCAWRCECVCTIVWMPCAYTNVCSVHTCICVHVNLCAWRFDCVCPIVNALCICKCVFNAHLHLYAGARAYMHCAHVCACTVKVFHVYPACVYFCACVHACVNMCVPESGFVCIYESVFMGMRTLRACVNMCVGPAFIHVCAEVCIHVCLCVLECEKLHLCVCANTSCMRACVQCTYAFGCLHMCVRVKTCACVKCIDICVCISVNTCMHVWMYVCNAHVPLSLFLCTH